MRGSHPHPVCLREPIDDRSRCDTATPSSPATAPAPAGKPGVRALDPHDAAGAQWPAAPVRVDGEVVVSLLGIKLASVRLDLTIAAIRRFVDVVTARHGPADDELDSMNRRDLYELVRDADIDGRSRMSKHELIEALRE